MSDEQTGKKEQELSPAVERLLEMVKKLTREEQLEVRRRLLEMVAQNKDFGAASSVVRGETHAERDP